MFFFVKQKTAYEMRISDWSSDVCSSDLRIGSRPFKIGFQLLLGREVLPWPVDFGTAYAGRFTQSPGGVSQMRASQRAKVGTPGRNNAVDMIGLEDGAHRNRGNSGFVTQTIGKRGLIHAAIPRLIGLAHFPRGGSHTFGPGLFEML